MKATLVTAEAVGGGHVVTQAWCPTCAEMVLPTTAGRCGWCDRDLGVHVERKPGRKRRGVPARVTDEQLALIHRVYVEKGVSVRQVAAKVWQQFGYASPNACANSLYYLLNSRGYSTRTVSQALARRNYRHGLSTRERRATVGDGEYRRWFKETHGRYQPKCAATTKAGKPCPRPAKTGIDYCAAHDPATALRRHAVLARMRARSPLRDPARVEPAAPLVASLCAYRAAGGSWRALSRAAGVPDHWLSHVAAGKQENVSRERAAAVRAALTPAEAAA